MSKILLATPHMHFMSADGAQAICQIQDNARRDGHDIGWITSRRHGYDVNRNHIFRHFYEHTDFEWIISIDADVIPPADIYNMLDGSRPIVAAICNVVRYDEIGLPYPANSVYTMGMENGKPVFNNRQVDVDTITKVDWFGTGCFAVHRDAITKMRQHVKAPLFRWVIGGDWGDETVMGEDFFFCARAREVGIDLHVDSRFQCKHVKEAIW